MEAIMQPALRELIPLTVSQFYFMYDLPLQELRVKT